jgi:hypothetical protein
MRNPNKWMFAVVLVLAIGLRQIAHGQEAKEKALSPGDVIKLEVKFDGPGADKITTVYASLQTRAEPPSDQAGYMTNFPGDFKLISPGTFHAEFTVPETAVSGDYVLISIDVRAPGIRLDYTNGKQYNLHAFHIENHSKFVQPPVTIKELH